MNTKLMFLLDSCQTEAGWGREIQGLTDKIRYCPPSCSVIAPIIAGKSLNILQSQFVVILEELLVACEIGNVSSGARSNWDPVSV